MKLSYNGFDIEYPPGAFKLVCAPTSVQYEHPLRPVSICTDRTQEALDGAEEAGRRAAERQDQCIMNMPDVNYGKYETEPDASLEQRHEKLQLLLCDIRKAAGCKPGESIVERCRELREHYEREPIRGSLSHGEVKTAKIVHDSVLQHAEGLTDDDALKFISKPVMNAERTQTIGRIASATRKGEFIVGTIEFDEGKEPQHHHTAPFTELLQAGAVIKGFGASGLHCAVGKVDIDPTSNHALVRAAEMSAKQTDFTKLVAMIEREDAYREADGRAAVVAHELLDAAMPKAVDEPQPESWRDRPSLL